MSEALIIAGASGAGKTTVANIILGGGKFDLVRSATTRPPRADKNTSEYIYLSREEFVSLCEGGEMLEFTEYGENFYGTPARELDRIFESGKIPLLIVDMNGVKTFIEGKFDFLSKIFYVYEELDVIERRLYARELSTPTADGLLSFIRRKEANINDYLKLPEIAKGIFAFVRNTDANAAAAALESAFLRDACESEILSVGERAISLSEELRRSALEKA